MRLIQRAERILEDARTAVSKAADHNGEVLEVDIEERMREIQQQNEKEPAAPMLSEEGTSEDGKVEAPPLLWSEERSGEMIDEDEPYPEGLEDFLMSDEDENDYGEVDKQQLAAVAGDQTATPAATSDPAIPSSPARRS